MNGLTPTKAFYNGNISAMKWKSGDESAERGYKFAYDGLDRLTAAAYGEGNAITTNPERFNETVTYNDKMGNIKTLQRQGKITADTYSLMDNLTYTYSGNKLTKVTDAVTASITNPDAFHFVDGANVANEYTYDANGNIVKDLNKNITSITYNSLNLPNVITFGDGNTATYVYDGTGNKLSVAYKSGTVTSKMDYAGNKVYGNGAISMILTEEGYVTLSGTTPTYYYYLKDHQGNNRVVINQAGAVQQVNHYYAFGGLFGEGLQSSGQPYKYNGKELDTKIGLNMYDYGARHYDAALGRWFTVDPMAEKYYGISPYVYCNNNPVLYIDPDGREWKTKLDKEFADKLSKAMNDRKDEIWMEGVRKYGSYKKAMADGNTEKAGKIEAEMAEMGKNMSNMNDGIAELKAMEETKDQLFTFNKVVEDIGGTGIVDGIIVMDIAGNGSIPNGIHESSHGYDFWKNGRYTEKTAIPGEIKAYRRQFSYNKSSLPVSYFGRANSLSDINHRWVLGLNHRGDYLYIKLVFPYRKPEDVINSIK